MNLNKNNFPSIRFKDFQDQWSADLLGEILVDSKLGGNYSNTSFNTERPLIKMGNIGRGLIILEKLDYVTEDQDVDLSHLLQIGDLLFNTRNTLELVGKVAIWRGELPIAYYNSNILKLQFDNNYFMNYCLNSPKSIKALRRFATGTTSVAAIYTRDLLKLRIRYPSLPEQQKIADFLSAVDKKIELLTRKKELLEQYKKGVMQKLFSQEIRFKDEEGREFGEWERVRLGDLAKRVKSKNKDSLITNVLTNSATLGVVSQQEYFDREIANPQNLVNYYVVKQDDFVYNPRISSSAPVGPIKRNKNDVGVMSPLYSVFRFKDRLYDFYEFYFETSFWYRYLHSVANFGARHDRMNITNEDFFKMPLPLPSKSERDKIVGFLKSLTTKCDLATKEVELWTDFKKGLLQQMFV